MSTATLAASRPGFDADLAEALLTIPVVRPGADRYPTIAPFDGLPLVEVPYSGPAEVDLAFETARDAQLKWERTALPDRKRVMLRFHDLLMSHRDECLDLVQWETGKTRMDALRELLAVCAVARHYARDARRLLRPVRRLGFVPLLTRVSSQRLPVGVVGVISPWSQPLLLAVADVIPALMAGNAVVLRPDHRTPLTALWAVDLLHRCGVPPRALQVVLGLGPSVGRQLVERADHVAFSGSSEVGAEIAAACGRRLVGCSLVLGGKNAMIVTEDVVPGWAAEVAARACFDNAGQLAVAVERLYVHRTVHDAFVDRLVSRLSAMQMHASVGWGSDYGSLLGADQLTRTSAVVDDAVAKGATMLSGGHPLPDVGPFYYAPTVLTGVEPGMRAFASETFGPVASVDAVESEQEAIARVNDSPFGLNASVLCGEPDHGLAIARQLRVGSVNVNEAYEATLGSVRAPVGGMRISGLGRRNGDGGLTRFTEEQTIAVQRGIGLGTPYGMEHDDWADLLVQGFRAMRRLPLK